MRVHEAAKKLKIDSKEILEILKKEKISVKSHMSAMPEGAFEKVKDALTGAKPAQPAEEKKVKQETKKEAKKGIKQEVKKEVKEEVKQEVKEEVKEEIKEEIKEEVKEEVKEEITEEFKEEAQEEAAKKEELEINRNITVGELAKALEVKPTELIKKIMSMGVIATINQSLNEEEIHVVCEEYGRDLKFKDIHGDDVFDEEEEDPSKLTPRAPIVTIMGHVDHGKTSLLDAIRETDVVSTEKGGITQKIGAHKVHAAHGEIIFLDTPGHEAFTAMRARGAKATDIVVLIVAADDGIMPQTVEAIDHAKAAGAPIVVAINKIDKDGAQPDKIMQELTKYNLLPEDWGGKVQVARISAKQKTGIDELLEKILLEAEMLELKTNTETRGCGVIIEGRLDKGRGAVGTVLLQKGHLKVGDPFITNFTYGKVRALIDDHGRRIKEAVAVMPVEVLGFEDVPNAGDKIRVLSNDKEVKQIAQKRSSELRRMVEEKKRKKITLEDLHKKIEMGAEKKLPLIIKGDSIGSNEALSDAILRLSADTDITINIIHKDVGDITENDVLLADASNAVIIGFFVSALPAAKSLAEKEGVEIKTYHIIHEAVDSIKAAMEGLLEPEYEEVRIGEAEVRQVFNIESENVVIAGCYVTKGKVYQDSIVTIKRGTRDLVKSKVESLKRFKEKVKEVKEGYDCGVVIEKLKDVQQGDIITFYEEVQKVKKL